MPRKHLIRTKIYPYHIYARSNNQEWFYLPKEDMWRIFCSKLRDTQEKFNFEIHNFVLMGNHFHLLGQTPNSNLDEVMQWFMRESSRTVNFGAQKINHVFGGPYKWSLIQHDYYYHHVYKYISQNPVSAGICRKVQDYPFSTLHYQTLKKRLPLEVLPVRASLDLEWINQSYKKEEIECIKRALKHRLFVFKENRNNRKQIFKNPPEISSQSKAVPL